MGKPGVDFPVLKFIPRTKFTCRGKKSGYYADLETNCQVMYNYYIIKKLLLVFYESDSF